MDCVLFVYFCVVYFRRAISDVALPKNGTIVDIQGDSKVRRQNSTCTCSATLKTRII